MNSFRNRRIAMACVGSIVLFLTVFLRFHSLPFFGVSGLTGHILIHLLVAATISAWMMSIGTRIRNAYARAYLLCSGFTMLTWLMIRTIKYLTVMGGSLAERVLWYLYYIPILMIPLFGVLAAESLTIGDKRWKRRRLRLLWIPTVLLAAAMQTNERTQWAFIFEPELYEKYRLYIHGPLYYMVLVWIAVLFFIMLGILVHYSAVAEVRKRFYWPLWVMAVAGIYTALYIFRPTRPYIAILELTVMYCAVNISLIEICIGIGLIPSNSYHGKLFDSSDLTTLITNLAFRPVFQSKKGDLFQEEVMEAALFEPQRVGGARLLEGVPIRGGYLFWQKDMNALWKNIQKLTQLQNQLFEENELLERENELEKERAVLVTQSRLYDRIAEEMAPSIQLADQLLAKIQNKQGDVSEELKQLCIIGVYLKRRANLVLLLGQSFFSWD